MEVRGHVGGYSPAGRGESGSEGAEEVPWGSGFDGGAPAQECVPDAGTALKEVGALWSSAGVGRGQEAGR